MTFVLLFYFVILHPDFTTIKLLNMSFVLVLNNHPIRTLDIYVIQCSDRLVFFSASTKFQMPKWSVYLNNNLHVKIVIFFCRFSWMFVLGWKFIEIIHIEIHQMTIMFKDYKIFPLYRFVLTLNYYAFHKQLLTRDL